MIELSEKAREKATSDELLAILGKLSFDQKRFIIARQNTDTDKEAAEAIGIRPRVVYDWRHRGAPLDEALALMALDGVTMALSLRRGALAKAMAVKVAGLDNRNARIRQGVATEIIEAELGKAQEFIDLTSKGERVGKATDEDIAKAVAIVRASGGGDMGG